MTHLFRRPIKTLALLIYSRPCPSIPSSHCLALRPCRQSGVHSSGWPPSALGTMPPHARHQARAISCCAPVPTAAPPIPSADLITPCTCRHRCVRQQAPLPGASFMELELISSTWSKCWLVASTVELHPVVAGELDLVSSAVDLLPWWSTSSSLCPPQSSSSVWSMCRCAHSRPPPAVWPRRGSFPPFPLARELA